MSIIIKKYIYQKIVYLWLPWLLFKDGRHRNFVKMAAKISQRPLIRFISIFQDLFIIPIYIQSSALSNNGLSAIFENIENIEIFTGYINFYLLNSINS